MTQNLTQNRKNWGGVEITQPPVFGLFQVTKRSETIEAQWMDKPIAAHNPEVVGSSPTPATIKPSDFERNQTVFSISSSKKLGLVFQPLRLTHFLTHTSQKRGPDTALPCPGLALF